MTAHNHAYAQTVALCILAAIVTWRRPVAHVPRAPGVSARVQTLPPAQPEKMMVAFMADATPILIEDFATQLRTYLTTLKKRCDDVAGMVNTDDRWQGPQGNPGSTGPKGDCHAPKGYKGSSTNMCKCSNYPTKECRDGYTYENRGCKGWDEYYRCCNQAKKNWKGQTCYKS